MAEEVMVPTEIETLTRNLSRYARNARFRGVCYLYVIALLLAIATAGFKFAGVLSEMEAKRAAEERNGVDMNDIVSCGNTAIAVGDHGVIGVSPNRGRRWRSIQSSATVGLQHVSVSKNCRSAVAVGDEGIALHSYDGGLTWESSADTGVDDTNSLALSADGTTAIIVGQNGTLAASYNGGATWERLLVLGSEDARDVALTEDGRVAVVAGDDGMSIVLERAETEHFAESSRFASHKASDGAPDFDAALIVDDQRSSGALRPFVFGRGIFEGGARWNQRSKARAIYDVAYRANCFTAVGRSGGVWTSQDGMSWISVGSGQGESIREIALSGDGRRVVARAGDRGLLIGRRETACSQELEWSFQLARTDHSSITHVHDDRFLVAGRRLDVTDGGHSVILSVDTGSGARPVNVGDEVVRVKEVGVNESDEVEATNLTVGQMVSRDRVFWRGLLMNILLRIGVTVVFLFLAAQLFGLARYEFRLATFYAARRDALGLIDARNFKRPASMEQILQLMRTMSPEHIEERASSAATVDLAWQALRGADRTTK